MHGRGYWTEARRRVAALRLARLAGVKLVAVSGDIQRLLESQGLGPVRLIPNGIDLNRAAGGERRRGRTSLGLPESALVIGTVGNLYPVKGHRVLLEAAAKVSAPVHVVIAGRGGEEEGLRRLAASLGIGSRVHLLGFRDDVPDLLAAADIYALPSFSEGQSLALLEAMAAGKPIVATAVGGNAEVLGGEGMGMDAARSRSAGPAGVLVPAGDADLLARALDGLLTDPNLARELGDAARARARREFSAEVMTSRYQALYDECLDLRRSLRSGRD
jgi:glycosyltransferase involved in cell wall biosynthesis